MFSAFFALLRAGLEKKAPDEKGLAAVAALSPESWRALYELSKRQTVSGIIFAGMQYLPDNLLPDNDLLVRLVARVHGIETYNRRLSCAMCSLFDILKGNGLHPVLQKGHAIARFYPEPDLRLSGDIDIFFPDGEKDAADNILRNRGINPRKRPDGSSDYYWNGIEIEHHDYLLDLQSPFHRKKRREIISRFGFREVTLADGNVTSVPAPLLELLMVSVHIMKHSFGVGVGMRQLCDYAMACRKLDGEYSKEEYRKVCADLGITKWSEMLDVFTHRYLGVEKGFLPTWYRDKQENDELQILSERLLGIIMEGGNFGMYLPDRTNSKHRWSGKLHTLRTFLRRGSFSIRIEPVEAASTFFQLLKGQI